MRAFWALWLVQLGVVLGIFISACSGSDQQKVKDALDKAGKTLDQACAERAALKDAGGD